MRAVEVGRNQYLAEYELEDIHNFDETGVYFGMTTNTTLATSSVHGGKKYKDRLTIGLCTNATGTNKLKPIVLGKAARPKCFGKTFNSNTHVDYKSNSNAWMTSKEFQHCSNSIPGCWRRTEEFFFWLTFAAAIPHRIPLNACQCPLSSFRHYQSSSTSGYGHNAEFQNALQAPSDPPLHMLLVWTLRHLWRSI